MKNEKEKYKFNPESLSFVKQRSTKRKRFWVFFKYLLFSVVISIAYYVVFSSFFDTPAERGLRRENEKLTEKFEEFSSKFDQITLVLEDIQQRDANIYRTIFETEPLPATIRQAGAGGVDRYAYLDDLSSADIVKATAKQIDNLSRQVYIQSKSFDEILELAKKKNEVADKLPSIQPIANRDLHRIASPFGVRMHPFYKVLKMHTGIDFVAPTGTPVIATGSGVVTDVIHSSRGYGNTIIIDHDFGYQTLYAHLDKILVRRGQKISRGEVIGQVGNTGMSVAPHLHYEVRKDYEPINPINFFFNELTPAQYAKIIELAAQSGQSLD